ncbi:MAG: HIT family protein [Thermosulfidibacteraceae bacterium]|jgi:histidine triad (HIT) family protein
MCVFCRIVKGELPSTKIYEDENFLAFLDIAPVNKGHTLVIPKKHSETFLDLTPVEAGKLFEVVNKVAKAVKESLDADGLNILVNCGEASGQEVFHVHVHIIPRFYTDGFRLGWRKEKYAEGEMESFAKKIREKL